MGGITSGIGLASGLDSASIIQQLIALESRPKILAQQRLSNIRVQQSAYLEINSRLQTLRSMVSSLRTQPIFNAKQASSSAAEVLTATASASASPGTYQFIVDRLVSTEQRLSRGFTTADSTPVGAGEFIFEGAQARLDAETALADLNGGSGVVRGRIRISDGTKTAEVDLSRSATVTEVLDAINAADVGVTARVRGGSFVLESSTGSGSDITVQNAGSAQVAQSLGLATGASVSGKDLVGTSVYGLTANTPLALLNDGNGVFANVVVGQTADFRITIDGDARSVRLGELYELSGELIEGKAVTVGDALKRMNDALDGTGVVARLKTTGDGIELFDSTGTKNIELTDGTGLIGSALRDLGFAVGTTVGSVQGRRVLAGMNSSLVSSLRGAAESPGDGNIQVRSRDGTFMNVLLSDFDTDVNGLLEQFRNQLDPAKVRVELDEMGTGLRFTDVSGGSGNFSIVGTGGGSDTAVALGISTGASGVASDTIQGQRLQKQYISLNTLVADLNGGKGIGTGTFRVIDASGASHEVQIGAGVKTVADLFRTVDSAIPGDTVKMRLNENGDGFVIEDTSGSPGRLEILDITGSVASSLRIKGKAADGPSNQIEGSYETRVVFQPSDTLRDVMNKINNAGAGVRASIVNEGLGANPFRLSLTARESGSAGRTIIDTGGFDLGLTQLERGDDAKAFFGSTDPAKAVLFTSSSNTITNVFDGLTLNLISASANPVTVTVDNDRSQLESKIEEFVKAFNDTLDRIDFQSRFDVSTQQRGPLLGDSTLLNLKRTMVSTILGRPDNVSGAFSNLSQVGLTIGSKGRLELDKQKLSQAIEQDPKAVEDLLVARQVDAAGGVREFEGGIKVTDPSARETFSTLGVFAKIEELARTYVDSVDGVLTGRGQTLDRQVRLQEDRIRLFDVRLADKRARLQREFSTLESVISNFQAQQAALSSLVLAR